MEGVFNKLKKGGFTYQSFMRVTCGNAWICEEMVRMLN